MSVKNYRELLAWTKAMELVTEVYRVSRAFPREEAYGLTSQIRRSAVSVPSNIAEGQGRGNASEFVRYLHIAHGSLRELETQILIAERLEYIGIADRDALMDLAAETGRLINGLVKSLG